MILVSLLILLISPTITKNDYKAQTAQPPVLIASPKPKNLVVVSMVAGVDNRADRLARYLASKDSPLVPYAQDFVEISDKYNLDYTFLPAITGVESSFGQRVPAYSYNPYGWNNGAAHFQNWVDATNQVASGIRTRYMPEGEVTSFAIGSRYAQDPFWAERVYRYQLEIGRFL